MLNNEKNEILISLLPERCHLITCGGFSYYCFSRTTVVVGFFSIYSHLLLGSSSCRAFYMTSSNTKLITSPPNSRSSGSLT